MKTNRHTAKDGSLSVERSAFRGAVFLSTSRLEAKNLPLIVAAFATNSLVERDRQTVQVVA